MSLAPEADANLNAQRAAVSAAVSDRSYFSGQIEALTAAGATTIFKEKISGVRADRPQLTKLMFSLKAGDVVTVTKLDLSCRKSNPAGK